MFKRSRKGVTLLELILVVAVLGILFAAIFVSLDPARRLAEANNSSRWIAVASIADAVLKQKVDNDGDYYSTVSAHVDSIASASASSALGTAGAAQYFTTTDADVDGIPDDIEAECSGLSFLSAFNCSGMTSTSDTDSDGAIDWYEVMVLAAATNHSFSVTHVYDPSDNTAPGSTFAFSNSDGADSVTDMYEVIACDGFGITITGTLGTCAEFDDHIDDTSDEDSDGTTDAAELVAGTYPTVDESASSSLTLSAGEYYYAMIGTDTSTCSKSTTLADVCDNVNADDTCVDLESIGANYLADVPIDPDATLNSRDATQTGYYLGIGSENELVIGSCDADAEGAGGSGSAETIRVFR